MSERINIIRKRVHQLLKSKRNLLHHQTYYALDDQWENIVNSKKKILKFEAKLQLIDANTNTLDKIKKAEKISRHEADEDNERNEEQAEEIIDEQYEQANERFTHLGQSILFINEPYDVEKCIQSINSQPALRNSEKGKIYTNYFVNMNSLASIRRDLMAVFDTKRKQFKMTVAFGYIFEVRDETEGLPNISYIVFRPSNTRFYATNIFIRNSHDMLSFVNSIDIMQLNDYIASSQPSSAHKIIGIYSMLVKVALMEHNIGTKLELPDFITNNPNIVNPESNNNMCFWNVVSYHELQNKRCAKLGKEIFKRVLNKTPNKESLGIDYFGDDIKLFEEKENRAVDLYEIEELEKEEGRIVKETVYRGGAREPKKYELRIVRQSSTNVGNVINVLIYNGHAMYIKNINLK